MELVEDRARLAGFLATQDASTLAQVLLELAEDLPAVFDRLERLRSRDDSDALVTQFMLRLERWKVDERFVRYEDAAAFGRDVHVWVTQVQREVLPRFPGEAMTLFAAFLELDRVVFERVDDDGGYVGGAFDLACQLWMTAAVAAGLSEVEIARRTSAMLSADHYGARSVLGRAISR
jgi:hypothetical protein